MGIVRSVEWKLLCSPEQASGLVQDALRKMGMDISVDPGSIHASSKRSLMKNRWAAEMDVSLLPAEGGTQVNWRIDMAGSKHYALLDEVAAEIPDERFDDRGLADAVARLGKPGRIFGRKEVRYLRNLLYSTEMVVELGQGSFDGKQGLLVLTTERLFFLEKSLGNETIEEFALPAIQALAISKKLGGERLVISTSGMQSEITNMWHGHADTVVRAFRQLKQVSTEAAPVAPAAAATDDPLTQIARLAQLRDQGILSVEEFEAKKRELMGRL